MFSSLDSDAEVCEVVKEFLCAELSLGFSCTEILCAGVMPEISECLTKTWARRVFLVSLLCLARSRLLVTEVGERVC